MVKQHASQGDSWRHILNELQQTSGSVEGLERRIVLCRQALAQVRRQAHPIDWAYLHFELGFCLSESSDGDRIEDLEEAIKHYGRASEVYTRRTHSDEWEIIQENLANSHYEVAREYSRRTETTGADDLERAIAHYEAALEMWGPKDYPEGWAQANHGLGYALFRRSQGDREENLERAIACYEAALSIRTADAHPIERAETLHNLGLVYIERYRDDRAGNLERAIQLFQAASEIPQYAQDRAKLAKTQSNTGTAYLQRIRGERADNVEQAIECYQAALAEQEQVGTPAEWAATNHNLGIAYAQRLLADRGENLERAIDHLKQALKEVLSGTYHYATTHNVLCDVRWRLGGHLRYTAPEQASHHLEQALDHARIASKVYGRQGYPRKWALAQHNMGNVYCDRIAGEPAQNLEDGIQCYQAALEVRTREALPFEWAQTTNNLGTAYQDRLCGRRHKNLEEAARYFGAALEIHQPAAFPVDARRAARNLGNLHFEERQWARAHAAYDTAVKAAETLYRASFSPGGKEAELAQNTTLYERLVQVCLEQPDYRAALVAAEGGKARTFLDQMGQGAFPPPPGLSSKLLRDEAALIESLRGQEQALSALSGGSLLLSERSEEPSSAARDLLSQRSRQLNALDAVWQEMARDPAAREYVAMRRGEPLTWRDMEALAGRLGPNAAQVEFYTLPNEIAVFILRAGWDAPRVHRAPVGTCQLAEYVARFDNEVAGFPFYEASDQALSEGDDQTWQDLAGPLMADVLPHLKDVEIVYFIPHGLLHYLPLHALEVNGTPLIEHLPIRFAYAPSAAVLGRVLEQGKTRVTGDPRSALVVGNPTGDLPGTEKEAQLVADRFGVKPYLGAQATRGHVLAEIERHRYVHLACHGVFHPSDPLQSGLKLHDGVLTAQEILELRLRAELVVLSACATGRQQVGRGDELMGLLRVLLYAGAPSLVASLWPVDDRSSLDLMQHFYQALDGQGPSSPPDWAKMLYTAMLEIRHEQGWEHPYFWAPFILVGSA